MDADLPKTYVWDNLTSPAGLTRFPINPYLHLKEKKKQTSIVPSINCTPVQKNILQVMLSKFAIRYQY